MTAFKPREVAKILARLGFVEKRQTGSHRIFFRSSDKKIIPVPMHTKDLKRGLVKGIIKQVSSSEEEFTKLK